MKQINMSKTKAHSQNRPGFDDSFSCQCKILTRIEFNLRSSNIFPVLNKGKSTPCRSRSPGSS